MTFEEWATAQGISADDWELYEVIRTAYEDGWQAGEASALWEGTHA